MQEKNFLSLTMSAKRLRVAVLSWPLDRGRPVVFAQAWDERLAPGAQLQVESQNGMSPHAFSSLVLRATAPWERLDEEQHVVTMHTPAVCRQNSVGVTSKNAAQHTLRTAIRGASTFVLVSP